MSADNSRNPLAAALAALVLLLITVVASGWLLREDLAELSPPVAQVYIEGQLRHLQDAEVMAVVRPLLGDRFLKLDVAKIQQALLSLPWLREVTVRKRWPDGVVLYLTERQPQARWGDHALVDVDGQVFRPQALNAAVLGLPQLEGSSPQRGPLLLTFYRAWSAMLSQRAGLRLEALREDARGSLRLHLAGDIEVLLGRHDAERRLQRLLGAVTPTLGARFAQAARIDLRYRDGFAVAWRAEPANVAPTGGSHG